MSKGVFEMCYLIMSTGYLFGKYVLLVPLKTQQSL
jgi:hypothetical protein